MISWWDAEGDTNDIVGTNNGSPMSGVTFASGKVGQAFNLDGGVNHYVEIPDSASLDITSQITIDAWIKPTVLGGRVVDKIQASGTDGYLLDTNGSKVRMENWMVLLLQLYLSLLMLGL
jgi:hypothetical protein